MSETKIAFVLSLKESLWRSCQVIVPNLCQLYRSSFPDTQFESFDYHEGMTSYEFYRSVQDLVQFAPDKIIICDHKPFPGRLLESLMYEMGGVVPPVYVHLFGDFSLYAPDWLEQDGYLQRMRVKFIGASRRQQSFVQQFVAGAGGGVDLLPFPVNERDYSFSAAERAAARKGLGWQGREGKDYLYTGRLSAQKNIVPLLKSFQDFLKLTGSSSRLRIAGSFDDLGYPFFGLYHPPEYSRYQFIQAMESLDGSSAREQIHFVGNLDSRKLRDYYLASDVFVSLSLHNDEDYGMAPAEALCCGMPLVLSDWGGYASFCLPEAPCALVRVKLDQTFFQVDYLHFVKCLIKYDGQEQNDEERLALSLRGQREFALSGNRERLQAIHAKLPKPFPGWNQKFLDFSQCFSKDRGNPFGVESASLELGGLEREDKKRIESRPIYRECYRSYLGAEATGISQKGARSLPA